MDELLKVKAVRERLKCSQAYAYRLIDEKRLPAIKIPASDGKKHLVRVKSSDLEAFIDSHHTIT